MVAPAIAGQFPVRLGKIISGLKKLGFSRVMEVASGADVTSKHESEEFIERMEKGERFMTTSCCPGYIQATHKHIPEIAPFVSDTRTPMHYSAILAAEQNPGTKTVFIGPCVAKRIEGIKDSSVDLVLTFEELAALFAAAEIKLAECSEDELEPEPSGDGRRYAVSGGVASAVVAAVGNRVEINPIPINGLSLKNLKLLSSFAKTTCPGNLVEVMACEGGCAGGSGVLGDCAKVTKAVHAFADQTPKNTLK
jgi:iron only hydrogenase large subunit-like protein